MSTPMPPIMIGTSSSPPRRKRKSSKRFTVIFRVCFAGPIRCLRSKIRNTGFSGFFLTFACPVSSYRTIKAITQIIRWNRISIQA